MDRNLALEAVRVTEAAALNCARLTGRGDEKAADQAAVDAMRKAFDSLAIDGTVVIGEGERDEAPMLYIGEKVGSGGSKARPSAPLGRPTRSPSSPWRMGAICSIARIPTWKRSRPER